MIIHGFHDCYNDCHDEDADDDDDVSDDDTDYGDNDDDDGDVSDDDDDDVSDDDDIAHREKATFVKQSKGVNFSQSHLEKNCLAGKIRL